MSGAPACLKDIINHSAYGANISLLGIQPGGSGTDWNTFVWKGLKMKGIYGREMYGTWQKMDAMLRSGLDVSPIITHRMHYTDFKKGFEVMASGQSGKVVLTWAE
jgi:threonine 3-dehydrogenase